MTAQHALGRQFHGTYIQDWHPERVPDHHGVHVGTRAAAVSRLRGTYGQTDHIAGLQSDGANIQADFNSPELHHVELHGRVHPTVHGDDPRLHAKLLHDHPDHDIFPYINDHEDIGKVSYLARPHAVKVKKKEPVKGIDHLTIELF